MNQYSAPGEAGLLFCRPDPARKAAALSGACPAASPGALVPQVRRSSPPAPRRHTPEHSAVSALRRANFALVHELPGRLRLRPQGRFSGARFLESALNAVSPALSETDITLSPPPGVCLSTMANQRRAGGFSGHLAWTVRFFPLLFRPEKSGPLCLPLLKKPPLLCASPRPQMPDALAPSSLRRPRRRQTIRFPSRHSVFFCLAS